jgi:hypothetical protein
MANAFTQQKLIDSTDRCLIICTGTIDTAGETLDTIDVSGLAYSLNANGKIMSGNTHTKSTYRVTIRNIDYSVGIPAGYVYLQWVGNNVSSTTNTTIMPLAGTGDIDFSQMRGGVIGNPFYDANTSGDIQIRTKGATAANCCYTLIIDLKKDARDYDAGQTNDPRAFNI